MSQSKPGPDPEPTCWECGATNDPGASECWLCQRPDWRWRAIAVGAGHGPSRDEEAAPPGEGSGRAATWLTGALLGGLISAAGVALVIAIWPVLVFVALLIGIFQICTSLHP
jgi:hypothetical protein